MPKDPAGAGAPRPFPKVSIIFFLATATLTLLAAFLLVSLESLRNMDSILQTASGVREKNLPEMLENQRTFINIESLRRLAEITYRSDDPKIRRAARINAQTLTAESVYERDPRFYEKALELSRFINTLVQHKDAVSNSEKALRATADEYSALVLRLFYTNAQPKEMQAAFTAFLSTSLGAVGSKAEQPQNEQDLLRQESEDAPFFDAIERICLTQSQANHVEAGACDTLKDLRRRYVQERHAILEHAAEARAQWEAVDVAMRELRDNIGTESEEAGTRNLVAIEDAAVYAHKISLYLFGVTFVLLAIYALANLRFIVKPLRWTTQKLVDLQAGKLHTPMPTIHITELHSLALLLDRFGEHLTELQTHTSQLEEDAADKRDLEEIMRTVFRASLDGYLVWDNNQPVSASAGFLACVGVATFAEFVEKMESLIPPPEHRNKVFARAIADGGFREEVDLHSADGAVLPCEVTHLRIDRRGMPQVLTYVRDLRKQKRNEEALRLAKDEAEEAAKTKSNFLARMSHEIRTPMNGVLGLTHLALGKNPPVEQRRFLEKIQASAKILLGVIDDILDFSKIESGRLTLESTPFSFSDMLHTVEDLFQSQALHKGLSFVVLKPVDMPDTLVGDALRLSQILLNLCGNALKFTEHGGVSLRIEREEETAEEIHLCFSVEDSGVGMTLEQRAGLFQPFVQADVSTTRKYGGTGLGLVISKLLVEMMGGSIDVESTPGVGSVFRFSVPLGKPAAQTATPEKATGALEQQSLHGLRVLLAEDNEINQEIAKALLEDFGVGVIVAGNGQEALDLLAVHDVDGILMDIQMPIMDGLTAAEEIRAHGREAVRGLPIIAMTAHVMQEDREKSLLAGMNDHITKPIDVENLRDKLLQWIAPKK